MEPPGHCPALGVLKVMWTDGPTCKALGWCSQGEGAAVSKAHRLGSVRAMAHDGRSLRQCLRLLHHALHCLRTVLRGGGGLLGHQHFLVQVMTVSDVSNCRVSGLRCVPFIFLSCWEGLHPPPTPDLVSD